MPPRALIRLIQRHVFADKEALVLPSCREKIAEERAARQVRRQPSLRPAAPDAAPARSAARAEPPDNEHYGATTSEERIGFVHTFHNISPLFHRHRPVRMNDVTIMAELSAPAAPSPPDTRTDQSMAATNNVIHAHYTYACPICHRHIRKCSTLNEHRYYRQHKRLFTRPSSSSVTANTMFAAIHIRASPTAKEPR